MRLTEIAATIDLDVVRDGEFDNLGLLTHKNGRVLAAYYDSWFAQPLACNSALTCVVANRELSSTIPEHLGLGVASDAKSAFYAIHNYLFRKTEFYWKDFETEIAADARIHSSAYISPNSVRIGRGTTIGARAVILDRSLIGSDCVIQSGAVIGGEGFEPKWVNGQHVLIPHAGGTKIGNSVQILCSAHIARAVFGGFTEIGDGTIVDALVHVAHNAKIGRNCEIAAQALVAGSTIVGDGVWIGPSACISSEVRIGDRAFITLGSVVISDVPEDARVSGYFAFDHKDYKRAHQLFKGGQLPR